MKKSTTSVLLWEAQQALLAQAAAKQGKNVSEYVRDVLVPLAAEREGLPVPKVPALAKPVARKISGTHAIDYKALAEQLLAAAARKVG